jgi:hypothetical protein
MTIRHPVSSPLLAGLLLLGSAGVSHSDQGRAPADGGHLRPAGFTAQQTALIAVSPGAFVRHEGRTVSGSQQSREWRRLRAGLQADAPSQEAHEDRQLEAEFLGDYASGLRLSLSSHPRAFVHLAPSRSARPAAGRIREDGAVITFEGAFPGVTAAFGGTGHRLDQRLLVPTAADLPEQRYTLASGPEFGHWVASEGQLWAFDAQGKSLFVLAAPAVTDATGRRVTGSWSIEHERGADVITAQLETSGLTFPARFELSVGAPEWFLGAGGSPPGARAGTAGGYDASRGCVAIFGGAAANFTPQNDVITRCAGGWQRVEIGHHEQEAPPTLAYSTLTFGAFASPDNRLYLFGGYPGEATSAPGNDLYGLTLSRDGARGEWSRVEPSGPQPAPRFMHGAAYDTARQRLIVWGGVDRQGNLLADTWAFTPSPPTWTQLCAGCFDARYGLTAVTQGTVATGLTISSLGGYDRAGAGGRHHNDVQRFDPACPGGACWSRSAAAESPAEGASEAPAPRFLAWGARDASDRIVWGSGVAGGNAFLADAWTLDAQARWSPLSAGLREDHPGPRESALAIYHEAHRELVLVGGVADESDTNLHERSLLHRGPGAAATLLARQTAPRTFTLRGRVPGQRGDHGFLGDVEGYFVGRDASTLLWEEIGGSCGTAATPIAAAEQEIGCTFVADRAYDLVDFRVRDGEFYSDSEATDGRGVTRGVERVGRPYTSVVSGCALPATTGAAASCR